MEDKKFQTAVEEANASVPRGKVKDKVREIEKNGGLIRTAFNNNEAGTSAKKSSDESNENFNQMENNAEQSPWRNALNSLNSLNIKENLTAGMNAVIPDILPRRTISSSVDPLNIGSETQDFKTGLNTDIVIPLDEFLRNLPSQSFPKTRPPSIVGQQLLVDRPIVCCPLEQAGNLFSAPMNTPGHLNPPMYPNMYPPPYPLNPWDPYLFYGLFPFGNDIFGEENLKQAGFPFFALNGPHRPAPEDNDKSKKRKSTKKKKKRKTEEGFEPSIYSWSHPSTRKSKWWEVWNKMENPSLKKHNTLNRPERIWSSPGQDALLASNHRVIRGNNVICACGRGIPRPIVAHMHSNKAKHWPQPLKCPTCQDEKPSCQHANCTHSNRTQLCECCPSDRGNSSGTSSVGRADLTEEGVTEVNATMVRSIQVSMRSKKNNHSRTKKFNLDIQTANLLGTLFLGKTAAEESPRAGCQGCRMRMTNSPPRDEKGMAEIPKSVHRTAKSISPGRLENGCTSMRRNCHRDENLNIYDSSFCMSSAPGYSKQGRHLKRLMSHFYHDLFTLPSRSDHCGLMDCRCCDDVDGCYPANVSLSTNTNRSNTALAQSLPSRAFPKANVGCRKSPSLCCKGRASCGYEEMETSCRRSNGNGKYFFESSKCQRCRAPRDFLVNDVPDHSRRVPHNSAECCKRCLTTTETCEDQVKGRKAETCLSFQCANIDNSTQIPDIDVNTSIPRKSVCHGSVLPKSVNCCCTPVANESKIEDVCKKTCKPRVSCESAACSSESSSSRDSAVNEIRDLHGTNSCSNSYISTLHVVARGSCEVRFCKRTTTALRRQVVNAKNPCVRRETHCSDAKCLVNSEPHCCSWAHENCRELCCRKEKERQFSDSCSPVQQTLICPTECNEGEVVHRSKSSKCNPICCRATIKQRNSDSCRGDHTSCCDNSQHMCYTPTVCCDNSQHVCYSPTVCCDHQNYIRCKKSNCEDKGDIKRCFSATDDKKQHFCMLSSCPCPSDPVLNDDTSPYTRAEEANFVECKKADRIQVCERAEANPCEFICRAEDKCLSSDSSKEKACGSGLNETKSKNFPTVNKRLKVSLKRRSQSQYEKAAYSQSEIIQKCQEKDFPEARGISNRGKNKRFMCSEKHAKAEPFLVTSPGNAFLVKTGSCIKRISAQTSPCIFRKASETSPCIKRKTPETSPCLNRKIVESSPCNTRKLDEAYKRGWDVSELALGEVSSDECRFPCFESNCMGCQSHIPIESDGKYEITKKETFLGVAVAVAGQNDRELSSTLPSISTSDDTSGCKVCTNNSDIQESSERNTKSLGLSVSGFQKSIIVTSRTSLSQDKTQASHFLIPIRSQTETDHPWNPCIPNFICSTENANEQTYVQYKRLLGYWESQCSRTLDGTHVAEKSSDTSLNKRSALSTHDQQEAHQHPDACSSHENSANGRRSSIVITPQAFGSSYKEKSRSCSSANRMENSAVEVCTSLHSPRTNEKKHDGSLVRCSSKKLKQEITSESQERREYKEISSLESLRKERGKYCLSNDSMSNSKKPLSSRSDGNDVRLSEMATSSEMNYKAEVNQRPCLDHVDESPLLECTYKRRKWECFNKNPLSECISKRIKEDRIGENPLLECTSKRRKKERFNASPLAECTAKRRKEESFSSDFNYKVEVNQKPCLDHVDESPMSECISKRGKKDRIGESPLPECTAKRRKEERFNESPLSECSAKKRKEEHCPSVFMPKKDALNCVSIDSIRRNKPQDLIAHCLNQKDQLANLAKAQLNKSQDRNSLSLKSVNQRDSLSSVTDCRYRGQNTSPCRNFKAVNPSSHSINRRRRQESPSYNRLNLHCPSADIVNKVQSSSSDRSVKRQCPELSCSERMKTKEGARNACKDCGTKKQRGETLASHRTDQTNGYKSPCLECTNGRHIYKSSKSSGSISKQPHQTSPSSYCLSKRQMSTNCLSERQMSLGCRNERAKLQCSSSGCINTRKAYQSPSSGRMYNTEKYKSPCTDCTNKQQRHKSHSHKCLLKRQSYECSSSDSADQTPYKKSYFSGYINGRRSQQSPSTYLVNKKTEENATFVCTSNVDGVRKTEDCFVARRKRKSPSVDSISPRKKYQCVSSVSLSKGRNEQSPPGHCTKKNERHKNTPSERMNLKQMPTRPHLNCPTRSSSSDCLIKHYKSPCLECVYPRSHKSPSADWLHTRTRKRVSDDSNKRRKRDISSSDCGLKFGGHTTSPANQAKRRQRSEGPLTDSTNKVQRYRSPCLDCGRHGQSPSLCKQESSPSNISDNIQKYKAPCRECCHHKERQKISPPLECSRKKRHQKIPSMYCMNEKGNNLSSRPNFTYKGQSIVKITTPSLDSVSTHKITPVMRTKKFENTIYSPCRDLIKSETAKKDFEYRSGSTNRMTFKCLASSSEDSSSRTTSHKNQCRVVRQESTTGCKDATSVKLNACSKFSSQHISQKHNKDKHPLIPVGHSNSNECYVVYQSSLLPCFDCSQGSKSSSYTADKESAKRDTLHCCPDSHDGGNQTCLSSVSYDNKVNQYRDAPMTPRENNSPHAQSRINVRHEKYSAPPCDKQGRHSANKIETLKIETDRRFARPCISCSRSIDSSKDVPKCAKAQGSHKECASHKIPLSMRCPGSNECLAESSKSCRSISSCLGERHRYSKWHCLSCQPTSDTAPPSQSNIQCSKKDTILAEYSLLKRSKENTNAVDGVSYLNSSSAAINLFYNFEASSSSYSSSPGKVPEPTLLLSSSSHVTSDGLPTPCNNIDGRIDLPHTEKGREHFSTSSSNANVSSTLSEKLFPCPTRFSVSSDVSEDSDEDYGDPHINVSSDYCLSVSESEGCQSQNCSYPTTSKNHEFQKADFPTTSQMATGQSDGPAPVSQRRFCVKRIPPVSQTSNDFSECHNSQVRSPAHQMAPIGRTTPVVPAPNHFRKSPFSQTFALQKPFESQACLKLKLRDGMDLGENVVKETKSIRCNDKHLVKYPLRGFKRYTSLPSRTTKAVGRNKKNAAPRELSGNNYVSTLTNIEENKPCSGTDLTNVIKRLENCDSREFWKILYDVKNGKLDENCMRESLAGKISGIEYTAIKTRETIGTKTICTTRNKSDALWSADYITAAAQEDRAYFLARTNSKESCLNGRSRSKCIYSSRPHSRTMNSKTLRDCDIDNMTMSTEWKEKTDNQKTAAWEEQKKKFRAEFRPKPVTENQSNERDCSVRKITNLFTTDEFIPENPHEQKEVTQNCRWKNSPKCLTNEMLDNTKGSGTRTLRVSHVAKSPPRLGLNGSNISKCAYQAQSRKKVPTTSTRERNPIHAGSPDDKTVSPPAINNAREEQPSPPSIKTCWSGSKVWSHGSEAACAKEMVNQTEKPPVSSTRLNNMKKRAPCRAVKRKFKPKKFLARLSSSSTSQKPLEEKLQRVPKKANKIKYISRFHKPLSSKFKTAVTSSILGETSCSRLPMKKKKGNAEPKRKISKSPLPPSPSLSSLSSNASETSIQKIPALSTKKRRGKQSSQKILHKSCSKARTRCLKCKLKRHRALLKSMPPDIGCDVVSDLCNEYLDVLQNIQNNIRLLKTVSKMPSPGSVVSSLYSQSDNSSYPHCESSDFSGNHFPYSGHQHHGSRHPAKQEFFGEVSSRRGNRSQRQPRYTRIFQYKKNGDVDLGYQYKILKNALKFYKKNFSHRSRSSDMVERQMSTRAGKHSKLQASCMSSSSWSDTLDDEPPSHSKKSNKFNHQMPKFSPSAKRLVCQMCSPCRKRTIRWGLGDKDLPITKTTLHDLKNKTNDFEAHSDRPFHPKAPACSSALQDIQCCPLCKRKPNTLITTMDILKGINKTVSSRRDDEGCCRANFPDSQNQCAALCDTRDERRIEKNPCCATTETKVRESFYETKVLPKTFQPVEQTPDIQRYSELKTRLESLKSKQGCGLSNTDKKKKSGKKDATQTATSSVRKNRPTKQLATGSSLTKYSSAPNPNSLMGMPSKLSPEFFNKSSLMEKNNVTGTGFKSIITVDHFETFNLNKYHQPAAAARPSNTSNDKDFYKQTKTLLQGQQNAKPNLDSIHPSSPQCSNYVQNKINELKQFIAASSNVKREHPILLDESKCLMEAKPVSPRRLPSTSESSEIIEESSQLSPKNGHTAHPITLLQGLVRDLPKAQSPEKVEEEVPMSPGDKAAGKECSDQALTTSKMQDAIVQCELRRSRLKTPKKNPEESSKNRKFLLISYNSNRVERNESQNRTSGLKNRNALGQIGYGLADKVLENGQNSSVEPWGKVNEISVPGAGSSTPKAQNVNDIDFSEAGVKVEELDVLYKSTDERLSSSSVEDAWHTSVPCYDENPEDDDLRTEVIDTDVSFL